MHTHFRPYAVTPAAIVARNDSSNSTDGNDVITGTVGDDTLSGGAGDDIIHGGGGSDTLNGDDGNDRLWADGFGHTKLNGGNGDDYLGGGFAYGGTWDGGAGVDTVDMTLHDFPAIYDLTAGTYTTINGVLHILNFENVVAGDHNDILNGNAGANVLSGNGGNDIIKGFDGIDTLNGGAGNDQLDGGNGADTMAGGLGDDTFFVDDTGDTVVENSGGGTDRMFSSVTYALLGRFVESMTLTGAAAINGTGNALDNSLTGNSAANTLDGGAGNDIITGGVGADTMIGRVGDDVFFVDNVGDKVVETSGAGNDTINSSVSYTLLGGFVETLNLTGAANINATGSTADNTLVGNTGNNALDGGLGNDAMTGGRGNDTYVVDNGADVVNELSGEGTDTIMSSVTWSLAGTYVENLTLTGSAVIDATGSAGNNIFTGNSAQNTLDGGTGNDTLNGGLGADTMIGGTGNDIYYVDNPGDNVLEAAGSGNDTVYTSVAYSLAGRTVETLQLTGSANIYGIGSSSTNTLIGNSGDNTLDGGKGADTLTGGLGADTFAFNLNCGSDKITDFSAAQNDLINVHPFTQGVAHTAYLSQVGADTQLDLGGGNVVLILNTTYNDPNLLSHIVW